MTFKTKSFFPKWKCFFGAPFNDRLQSHSLDTPLAAQAPTSSFSQDNLKTFFSNNPDLLNLIKQHQRPTFLCCFCVWFQVPKDSNGKNKGNVSCAQLADFPDFLLSVLSYQSDVVLRLILCSHWTPVCLQEIVQRLLRDYSGVAVCIGFDQIHMQVINIILNIPKEKCQT